MKIEKIIASSIFYFLVFIPGIHGQNGSIEQNYTGSLQQLPKNSGIKTRQSPFNFEAAKIPITKNINLDFSSSNATGIETQLHQTLKSLLDNSSIKTKEQKIIFTIKPPKHSNATFARTFMRLLKTMTNRVFTHSVIGAKSTAYKKKNGDLLSLRVTLYIKFLPPSQKIKQTDIHQSTRKTSAQNLNNKDFIMKHPTESARINISQTNQNITEIIESVLSQLLQNSSEITNETSILLHVSLPSNITKEEESSLPQNVKQIVCNLLNNISSQVHTTYPRSGKGSTKIDFEILLTPKYAHKYSLNLTKPGIEMPQVINEKLKQILKNINFDGVHNYHFNLTVILPNNQTQKSILKTLSLMRTLIRQLDPYQKIFITTQNEYSNNSTFMHMMVQLMEPSKSNFDANHQNLHTENLEYITLDLSKPRSDLYKSFEDIIPKIFYKISHSLKPVSFAFNIRIPQGKNNKISQTEIYNLIKVLSNMIPAEVGTISDIILSMTVIPNSDLKMPISIQMKNNKVPVWNKIFLPNKIISMSQRVPELDHFTKPFMPVEENQVITPVVITTETTFPAEVPNKYRLPLFTKHQKILATSLLKNSHIKSRPPPDLNIDEVLKPVLRKISELKAENVQLTTKIPSTDSELDELSNEKAAPELEQKLTVTPNLVKTFKKQWFSKGKPVIQHKEIDLNEINELSPTKIPQTTTKYLPSKPQRQYKILSYRKPYISNLNIKEVQSTKLPYHNHKFYTKYSPLSQELEKSTQNDNQEEDLNRVSNELPKENSLESSELQPRILQNFQIPKLEKITQESSINYKKPNISYKYSNIEELETTTLPSEENDKYTKYSPMNQEPKVSEEISVISTTPLQENTENYIRTEENEIQKKNIENSLSPRKETTTPESKQLSENEATTIPQKSMKILQPKYAEKKTKVFKWKTNKSAKILSALNTYQVPSQIHMNAITTRKPKVNMEPWKRFNELHVQTEPTHEYSTDQSMGKPQVKSIIYNTPKENVKAFKWNSNIPQWETTTPDWELLNFKFRTTTANPFKNIFYHKMYTPTLRKQKPSRQKALRIRYKFRPGFETTQTTPLAKSLASTKNKEKSSESQNLREQTEASTSANTVSNKINPEMKISWPEPLKHISNVIKVNPEIVNTYENISKFSSSELPIINKTASTFAETSQESSEENDINVTKTITPINLPKKTTTQIIINSDYNISSEDRDDLTEEPKNISSYGEYTPVKNNELFDFPKPKFRVENLGNSTRYYENINLSDSKYDMAREISNVILSDTEILPNNDHRVVKFVITIIPPKNTTESCLKSSRESLIPILISKLPNRKINVETEAIQNNKGIITSIKMVITIINTENEFENETSKIISAELKKDDHAVKQLTDILRTLLNDFEENTSKVNIAKNFSQSLRELSVDESLIKERNEIESTIKYYLNSIIERVTKKVNSKPKNTHIFNFTMTPPNFVGNHFAIHLVEALNENLSYLLPHDNVTIKVTNVSKSLNNTSILLSIIVTPEPSQKIKTPILNLDILTSQELRADLSSLIRRIIRTKRSYSTLVIDFMFETTKITSFNIMQLRYLISDLLNDDQMRAELLVDQVDLELKSDDMIVLHMPFLVKRQNPAKLLETSYYADLKSTTVKSTIRDKPPLEEVSDLILAN